MTTYKDLSEKQIENNANILNDLEIENILELINPFKINIFRNMYVNFFYFAITTYRYITKKNRN